MNKSQSEILEDVLAAFVLLPQFAETPFRDALRLYGDIRVKEAVGEVWSFSDLCDAIQDSVRRQYGVGPYAPVMVVPPEEKDVEAANSDRPQPTEPPKGASGRGADEKREAYQMLLDYRKAKNGGFQRLVDLSRGALTINEVLGMCSAGRYPLGKWRTLRLAILRAAEETE